jgi:HEAT repeat protein
MALLAFVILLAPRFASAVDGAATRPDGLVIPGATAIAVGDRAATVARVQKSMSSGGILWPQKVLRQSDVAPAPSASAPVAPPPSGNTAATVLVETAQSEDVFTRIQGLEGLAQSGGVEYVDTFVSALADPAPEVREAAAAILNRLEPATASKKVLAALSMGDAETVARVDSVLPLLKDVLEPYMIHVLETEEEPSLLKQVAAYTLGRMSSTVAVPVLVARAWQPDAELATACAHALMAMNDPMVMPVLANLARHPIAEIRWSAVQSLAKLGGPEALGALGQAAIEPPENDEELGRQAVTLLGETRADAAIPVLIEVMRRNLGLRRAAVEALHKMTGEDLGDRPSDWQAWYEARLQDTQNQQALPPPDAFGPLPFDVEYLPEPSRE